MAFSQSAYTVNETNGSVEILLHLSNPASIGITVNIFTSDGSATASKRYGFMHMNFVIFCKTQETIILHYTRSRSLLDTLQLLLMLV